MDRQTLYIVLFAAAMFASCNRSKSPQPTAQPAVHKQEAAVRGPASATHNVQSSSGGAAESKANKPDLAVAEAGRAAAVEAAQAAAEREQALAEQQKASAQM